ncbi:MAG TPA: hypothetical protein VNQ14_09660, partial [Woeseiaceae bacterium]|nr:hypothetical protein [Woeseiaceae bacterium]
MPFVSEQRYTPRPLRGLLRKTGSVSLLFFGLGLKNRRIRKVKERRMMRRVVLLLLFSAAMQAKAQQVGAPPAE